MDEWATAGEQGVGVDDPRLVVHKVEGKHKDGAHSRHVRDKDAAD